MFVTRHVRSLERQDRDEEREHDRHEDRDQE
jgi:hypothetical protein